jgi:hypothetical protein
MKIPHILLLLLWMGILLPAPAAGESWPPQNDDWKEFKSYEGNFRVLTPAPLKEKIDSIETQIGRLAYHTFFYQSPMNDAENVLYMVSYCDYPEGTVHSDSTEMLEEFFTTTMEAAAESVDGELIYSNDVEIGEYPGKFWRINYLRGQAVIKTKAFLVKNRYYAVQTIMFREMSLNPKSNRFMDSFDLLK